MIACGRCGASNPEGARFCSACGSAIGTTCPRCGSELPGSVRFCPSCGAEISTPDRAEEQRKVVSVLFCDLVGFTARAEDADPEDVRVTLRDYHATAREVIERFGGVVEKFIGDAVMAVFGIPTARGDDAERAVRAALEIPAVIAERNAITPGADLEVRLAVNTGETVVTLDQGSAVGEVLVAGDVVNTAARLQAAANPGWVLVGEETYRSTRRSIGYEPVEPVDAKGKKEPVLAWRAIVPTVPFSERAPLGSSFVGREGELNLLEGIWDRAAADARPHFVTILGEAGVGKSRLTAELAHRVEASGGRVYWVRELPYKQSSGYEAFGQLVKDVAGIFETDSGDRAKEKLQDSLRALEVTDPGVVKLLSFFGGAPDAVAFQRRELFDAARRYLAALAASHPVLVVFEDIHWAHASMLDLIESLAGRTKDVATVFVALARPELLDLRPGWSGGLAASTTIRLEPLSASDGESLAAQLIPDLSPEVATQIEATAGGNPLFIEEMAAAVAERGDRMFELPTTVRAMIAARLDALPREERQVLYEASVVGKVFWLGALVRLRPSGANGEELDVVLDSLEARDIIKAEPDSRVEGDREYAFRHMLIRDVAYATLPRGTRRERHEAVARFIEDAAPDSHAVAAILAYHWREAGDAERAVTYLLSAAERAELGWACAEAVELYEEALSLIPDEDVRRRTIGIKRSVAAARYDHAVADEAQLRSSGAESATS